jgi:hypothetical protein
MNPPRLSFWPPPPWALGTVFITVVLVWGSYLERRDTKEDAIRRGEQSRKEIVLGGKGAPDMTLALKLDDKSVRTLTLPTSADWDAAANRLRNNVRQDNVRFLIEGMEISISSVEEALEKIDREESKRGEPMDRESYESVVRTVLGALRQFRTTPQFQELTETYIEGREPPAP